MRLFYLVCTIIVGILIIILSVAQFGASCSWYLLSATASPVFVLIMISILGSFMGAFFILYLLSPKVGGASDGTEE